MAKPLSLNAIVYAFEKRANSDNAYHMAKYMRNQFEFFGVKSPQIKELLAELLREHGTPDKAEILQLADELWNAPQRELQFTACQLLTKIRRKLNLEDIPFLLDLVTRKSWWDTVDTIAPRLIGGILLRKKDSHTTLSSKWISSPNFWVQRTALLYALKWKSETDAEHLFNLIRQVADEKEFFIQKAIGWILREYSKTNAKAVRDFVASTQLSPLSKREALKWLNSR